MHIKQETIERHTLAVIVDNEPGILARIAGLFTARGYNIESLTVTDISEDDLVSRITIVTSASAHVMEQIIAQLERLVPVHKVLDLSLLGPHVERELARRFVLAVAVRRQGGARHGQQCEQRDGEHSGAHRRVSVSGIRQERQ